MTELLNNPKLQVVIIEVVAIVLVAIIGKLDKKNIVSNLLKKISELLETK